MDISILDKDLQTTDMEFSCTDMSTQVEVGQKRNQLSAGPYQPILSGTYNVISYVTSDFESIFVTEVI
jgi:hypothetical protein